ncbi:geranylgeranylglycerol-phosphate geranylgeranyltransferase [Aureivirga sp. CE67]|uniref:geranylgeranylglycerol-phosphate geranylgeranyltransferase n=1 Tax=Aureivirga sp. CE67 TaxID=1788983 RepID=UPI0018CA22F5|nr:geranylgeranylglycerol-phosphate geranylgeranyltransferase [Aureivirga sp. CE67]
MNKIIAFLSFIRWKNLLIMIVMQLFFKFGIDSIELNLNSLSYSVFFLLIFATFFIAAAGNLINDYFDIECDKINKPRKSLILDIFDRKSILKLYTVLNIFGFISGLGISIVIGKPLYSFIFLGIILILFLYSKFLKKTLILGNFLIALLLSISVILVPLFEQIPFHFSNKIFDIIFNYALFVFIFNLFREIIKDIEDIDGDYKIGAKTLPIILGRKRAKNISLLFAGASLYQILDLSFNVFETTFEIKTLFVIFIFLPIMIVMYKTTLAEKKSEFRKISNYIKIILAIGVFSILFLKYFIQK